MTGRGRRLAVAAVLAVVGLGITACSANDNGGVITGTTTPTTATPATSTPTTVAPTPTTLSGGTLPAS